MSRPAAAQISRPAVVVDHDGQVAVPLLVADLIDPDPAQPGEPVQPGHRVLGDPGDDRPDGAPGDPHQLGHRGLRAGHRQPRDLIIEEPGVPGAVPRPGHRRDHHPVLGAAHPRRVGLQHRLPQRPGPAPASVADPAPGHSPGNAAGTAHSGAAPRGPAARARPAALGPHRTRPGRPWSSRPPAAQPITCHCARRSLALDRSQPGNWNRRQGTACRPTRRSRGPRMRQESLICPRYAQVIPEGAGPVNPLVLVVDLSFGVLRRFLGASR